MIDSFSLMFSFLNVSSLVTPDSKRKAVVSNTKSVFSSVCLSVQVLYPYKARGCLSVQVLYPYMARGCLSVQVLYPYKAMGCLSVQDLHPYRTMDCIGDLLRPILA